MGQIVLRVFRFPSISIISSMLHNPLHLHVAVTSWIKRWSLGNLQKSIVFCKSGNIVLYRNKFYFCLSCVTVNVVRPTYSYWCLLFSQKKVRIFFCGLIKHHDTRTYSRVCALLPSALKGENSFFHRPSYFKCQISRYPLNRSLPGHQSRSECCRKENLFLFQESKIQIGLCWLTQNSTQRDIRNVIWSVCVIYIKPNFKIILTCYSVLRSGLATVVGVATR